MLKEAGLLNDPLAKITARKINPPPGWRRFLSGDGTAFPPPVLPGSG